VLSSKTAHFLAGYQPSLDSEDSTHFLAGHLPSAKELSINNTQYSLRAKQELSALQHSALSLVNFIQQKAIGYQAGSHQQWQI
jgi:hypothetical protein